IYSIVVFFFFQAEDGIRDRNVTGVQTCALPILIDDASLLMMDSQTLGLVEVESLRDLVVEYRTIINNDLLTNVKRVFDKEVFSAGTQEYKVYPSEEETSGDLLEYLSEEASKDETEENI